MTTARAVDRRRRPRVGADHLGWVVGARLRPGVTVTVVDLSGHGALVETATRVRPGSRAELCVDLGGRSITTAATVTRAAVSALDRRRGAVYHVALRFDAPVAWPAPSVGKPPPRSAAIRRDRWGSGYPSTASGDDGGSDSVEDGR